MDVLSEVLRGVRLTGAVFFDIDASAPWAVSSPRTSEIRAQVMPGSEHLMAFHFVMAGSGFIEPGVPGGAPVAIEAGDVIVLPRGDAHDLSSEAGRRVPVNMAHYRRPVDAPLPFSVAETGGGAPARIVCGYFGCDAAPFNPLLEALPRLTVIKAGPRCEHVGMQFITAALDEKAARRPGGEIILARLSELMLVQALRLYIDTLPEAAAGWLSGLRDPLVGRALQLIHGEPSREWTLDSLARAAGLSRSVLAERFVRLVGQPPMSYLARWRMQLAAHALREPSVSISAIAADVGYQSEAAFNRAFKKIVGTPPGSWRKSRRDAA